MDNTAREPKPETVPCVVCGKELPLPPGMILDKPPFCSTECFDKWDRGMEAPDA